MSAQNITVSVNRGDAQNAKGSAPQSSNMGEKVTSPSGVPLNVNYPSSGLDKRATDQNLNSLQNKSVSQKSGVQNNTQINNQAHDATNASSQLPSNVQMMPQGLSQQQIGMMQQQQFQPPANVMVAPMNQSALVSSGQNQMTMQNGRADVRSVRSVNSRKSVRSSNNSQYESHFSMMSNNSQPSSIPGKTQRILINKKTPFSASSNAKRVFNRGNSQNRTGKVGSLSGPSSLSTATTFSSFADASTKLKKEQQFGTKQRRFDAKIELKEYFNRDPGPGGYLNVAQADENQDTRGVSKKGFLNGFASKADRFAICPESQQCDPNIHVGPGQYNPKPIEKNIQVPRLDPKGEFSLPFNEKNPLNYVKPITVNIYFKQSNPGVGYYDPEPVYKNVPAASSVFVSATTRGQQESIRKMTQQQFEPAPGTYNKRDGFDIKFEEKDLETRQFKKPMAKKIFTVHLNNPHQPAEDKKREEPGPASYQIARDFDAIPEMQEEDDEFNQPRFRHIEGGKIYSDDNNDRFGLPLRPMKPIDMVPGPGAYFIEGEGGANNLAEKAIIEDAKTFTQEEKDFTNQQIKHKRIVPGPAFYNQNKEPKKISFLFNPAEKWV